MKNKYIRIVICRFDNFLSLKKCRYSSMFDGNYDGRYASSLFYHSAHGYLFKPIGILSRSFSDKAYSRYF